MQISRILYFLCYLQVFFGFPDEEKLFQIKIWIFEKKPSKNVGGVWYIIVCGIFMMMGKEIVLKLRDSYFNCFLFILWNTNSFKQSLF